MHKKRLFFSVSLLMLLVSILGCAPDGPALEPLPALGVDDMDESVRAQISTALAAVNKDETNPELNGRLGMLLDAYQLPAEAAGVYARARVLAPGDYRWVYLHGLMLAELGEDDPAIDALQLTLELRPDTPGAQLELARLLGARAETEAAATLFTQLIERHPRFVHAHYAYGKFLLDQGAPEAAAESLKIALGMSNRYGKANYALALAYRELGQIDKAALHFRLYERYIKNSPRIMDPLRAEVESLNRLDIFVGEQALKTAHEQPRETAARLEELATERQGFSEASVHINLIVIFGQLGDYNKVQQHADMAMSIQPDSRELHQNMGEVRRLQGRYDDAAEYFLRAIELDPEYSVLHVNLGSVREAAGRLEEAIASYRHALELDPFDRRANYHLARALAYEKPADESSP